MSSVVQCVLSGTVVQCVLSEVVCPQWYSGAVCPQWFRIRIKDHSQVPEVSLEAKMMSSSAASSLDNVSLRCLSIRTSVLSEFNKRTLRVIQVFLSFRRAWSLVN